MAFYDQLHAFLAEVVQGKYDSFLQALLKDNIEVLDLSWRSLGLFFNKLDLMLHLARALKGSRVFEVNLNGNQIGDDGLANLMNNLENTRVENLILWENKISTQGYNNITPLIKKTKLTRIIDNKIPEQLKKALEENVSKDDDEFEFHQFLISQEATRKCQRNYYPISKREVFQLANDAEAFIGKEALPQRSAKRRNRF
jgi:hypothetical protein